MTESGATEPNSPDLLGPRTDEMNKSSSVDIRIDLAIFRRERQATIDLVTGSAVDVIESNPGDWLLVDSWAMVIRLAKPLSLLTLCRQLHSGRPHHFSFVFLLFCFGRYNDIQPRVRENRELRTSVFPSN